MNYFKSALAGFGMSFIGTSLCGAKMGEYLLHSIDDHKNSKFLKNLLLNGVKDFVDSDGNKKNHIIVPENLKNYIIQYQDDSYGISDEFSNTLKPYDAWCGSQWTFPKAFVKNNIACIPTAILGAAYHDYFGKDVAQKFNDYFKTDVSPYILDGAVFGSLVLFCGIPAIALENEIDKTFILSTFMIQGFVLGCTAAFGAYFGDEEVSPQNEELDLTPLAPC
jgi:hypothetical protein